MEKKIKALENTEDTWLFAAAPIDRFRGPKDTHALKRQTVDQINDCPSRIKNDYRMFYIIFRSKAQLVVCIKLIRLTNVI